MMVSRFLLLALIALFFTAMSVAAAAADDAEFNPEGSLVVNLSEATFDEQLSKTEYALVEFYAPWCPHCKKLVPPYEQLAKEVSEDPQLKDKVTIAKIDCDVNQGVPSKFGVQGFPTIKLLKNGKLFKDYDGPRTAEAFKNFLIKKTGPSTVSLKSLEEAKAFVTEKRAASATTTIVIGQFLSADSENRQKFLAAADEAKLDGFLFAEVVGDSNIEKEQYEVHPYFEDASVDTADFDHIASFVISKGFPKVDELSGETFTRFADAGLPIVIAFTKFSDEDMKKKTIDLMNEVAKDEKLDGKVSLTYSDGDIYGEQYKVMGGNPEQLPGIAIMNLEKRTNFPYTGEWKADEISAFIQGVVSGEIQPNVRSQPVPETQDEPVYVLVGKNFDEIVLNEDRDVFVEFYAPWCGHCKTLAPQYEEVAKAFSSVPQDKLIIAKIDATENDTPNAGVEVQGFPTLYFYPAGKKAPIAYEGDRTAADMIAFVKKHAVAAKELVHDEL